MVYWLLYPIAFTGFFFFYRRIYRIGSHHIPASKQPTIIIANHSNGFVDPIILASYQRRGLYFWARANEFQIKGLRWFLESVHMLPIFRAMDGKDSLVKNAQTFARSRELLNEGKMLFVAPEGNCYLEKRLRPLKTGTARLAFEAMAEYGMDLQILPAGLNFSDHVRSRSQAIVCYGKPLQMRDYLELHTTNPRAAIAKLNDDMNAALRELLIHIHQPEDDAWVNDFLWLFREARPQGIFPIYSHDSEPFTAEKAAAERVQALPEPTRHELHNRVRKLTHNLRQNGLTAYGIGHRDESQIGRWIGLLLFAPIALVGWLGGAFPAKTARALRNKLVQDETFIASVALVLGAGMWIAYGLVVGIAASFWLGWWALALPFAMMFLQFISLLWIDQASDALAVSRYGAWRKKNPTPAQELEADYQEIRRYF